MHGYDLAILVVFLIFAADIVGPRAYQAAQWWFDHKAEHDELFEEDEAPPGPSV